MSGRFIDRTATQRLSLGDCQCPGTPHDEDYLEVRTQFSGIEWREMVTWGTKHALAIMVTGWNLRNEAGDLPLTAETLADLDSATFEILDRWFEINVPIPDFPNRSGAHSRNGSRVSASSRQPKSR